MPVLARSPVCVSLRYLLSRHEWERFLIWSISKCLVYSVHSFNMALRFPQHMPSFKYSLFRATRHRWPDKWENRTRRDLANSQKRRTRAKTVRKGYSTESQGLEYVAKFGKYFLFELYCSVWLPEKFLARYHNRNLQHQGRLSCKSRVPCYKFRNPGTVQVNPRFSTIPGRKFRNPETLPGNPGFSRIPCRKFMIFQKVKRWDGRHVKVTRSWQVSCLFATTTWWILVDSKLNDQKWLVPSHNLTVTLSVTVFLLDAFFWSWSQPLDSRWGLSFRANSKYLQLQYFELAVLCQLSPGVISRNLSKNTEFPWTLWK